MKTATKPLGALTAADLMSRDVMAFSQHMSLRGAAHLLVQDHISGAPVVDDEGRCIGVISATDFLSDKHEDTTSRGPAGAACAYSAWQVLDPADGRPEEVCQPMTPAPVTITLFTPIAEVARLMRDRHIRRVIVVDGEHRPVGIVSTSDIVAAVAEATIG
jgi:CBS domain-containing protein